ncbi:hypothetical protein [Bosea sp. UNC402CLCol]|uniref:hypothetical protein n=1 Tax=Bosea sp. UNC402CLCol TaxID=1510531 RepID=UPI0012E03592|nr:hypothetical protein [Bosea sp. UNC402CLCol]
MASLKQRFAFTTLTESEDRLAYAVLKTLSSDGHGNYGSCGVAEFDLIEFAEALDWPPGETLRRLKRIASELGAVCVEHQDVILFATAGAQQEGFDHLYRTRGFEGRPPVLRRK